MNAAELSFGFKSEVFKIAVEGFVEQTSTVTAGIYIVDFWYLLSIKMRAGEYHLLLLFLSFFESDLLSALWSVTQISANHFDLSGSDNFIWTGRSSKALMKNSRTQICPF